MRILKKDEQLNKFIISERSRLYNNFIFKFERLSHFHTI